MNEPVESAVSETRRNPCGAQKSLKSIVRIAKNDEIDVISIVISHGCECGQILIDNNSGLVACDTTFGRFLYSWRPSHCGIPVLQFMQEVNFDYAMRKFIGKEPFDFDLTVIALKEDILQTRRDMGTSKQNARDMYDAICQIGDEWTGDIDEGIFYYKLFEETNAYDWWNGVPPIRRKWSVLHEQFWKLIWVPAMKAIKEQGHV